MNKTNRVFQAVADGNLTPEQGAELLRRPSFLSRLGDVVGYFCALLCVVMACTPGERRDAVNGALDAAQIACALNHAELGDEDVAKVCAIEGALAPILRTLLASHRSAMARETSAAAARDGGCK